MTKLNLEVDLENYTASLSMDGKAVQPKSFNASLWQDEMGKWHYYTSWSEKTPDQKMTYHSVQFDSGDSMAKADTKDSEKIHKSLLSVLESR